MPFVADFGDAGRFGVGLTGTPNKFVVIFFFFPINLTYINFLSSSQSPTLQQQSTLVYSIQPTATSALVTSVLSLHVSTTISEFT
jgi:hypothetical protein